MRLEASFFSVKLEFSRSFVRNRTHDYEVTTCKHLTRITFLFFLYVKDKRKYHVLKLLGMNLVIIQYITHMVFSKVGP